MKKDDLSQGKKLRRNLRSSGEILSAKADFSDNRQITPISSTETTMRMAALASSDWEDGSSGAVEDGKYKMSLKQFIIAIPICVIIICLLALIPSLAANSDPTFISQLERNTNVEANLELLEDAGVNTVMAGTNGKKLSFTYHFAEKPLNAASPVHLYSAGSSGNLVGLSDGDQVICDFKSYCPYDDSLAYEYRYMRVTINGNEMNIRVSTDDAVTMYMAALRQNELQDQFKADSGVSFSKKSLKKELEKIDRQALELELYRPWSYPYNKDTLASLVLKIQIAVPVLVIGFLIVINLIRKHKADVEYAKQWNEESSQRWKSLVEEE